MSGILVQNQNETISISVPDIYGGDFKLDILDQASGTWLSTNITMTEYLNAVESNTTTVSIDANAGVSIISVADASGFVINNIISVSEHMYRIIDINENDITLHRTLYNDVYVDDEVSRVGNMSIYACAVNISTTGEYLIRAHDEAHGIELIDSIKVVPRSLDTMYKDIKNLEYAILGEL